MNSHILASKMLICIHLDPDPKHMKISVIESVSLDSLQEETDRWDVPALLPRGWLGVPRARQGIS